MKYKGSYSEYGKRFLSLMLVMVVIFTTIPSSVFTPVFADNMQKGRFLVAYEKGADKETMLFDRGMVGIDPKRNEAIEIKNGELISEGKENIALVKDSKLGISSTFKNDKILAIEEDRMVFLLDDENIKTIQNEVLDVEENNATVENNFVEENQEIKNSFDKYITKSKGKHIKIALIDSGVNVATTTGSAVNLAGGISFIGGSYCTDENGHGTSLAGILKGYTASDGTTFEGLAPEAELYSLKVLDEEGKGYYSDVIKALDWAKEHHIDVVIMSFGAEEYSGILHRSIQQCYFQDMLLVSAGGNNNDNVKYPAAYTEVMAVGSGFHDDVIVYDYDNKSLVELYAEGQNVPTIDGDYEPVVNNGSSYSAVIVAAVSASLWSADRTLNARQVRGVLTESAKTLALDGERYPLLDASRAEGFVVSGTIPPEKAYDSEIIDSPFVDQVVQALEVLSIPEDGLMWEEATITVRFTHDHQKIDADLVRIAEDGLRTVVESITLHNVTGSHDPETGQSTGELHDFTFQAPYQSGRYVVDFYPFSGAGEPQPQWKFSCDEFVLRGADLAVTNFALTSSEDIVLGKEWLTGTATIQNVKALYSTDYPSDVTVDFYRVQDSTNDMVEPTCENISTLLNSYKIDSQTIRREDLQNKQEVDVSFAWKPEQLEEIQHYKIYAVIQYDHRYDDVFENNLRRIGCDATVTFHLNDGRKLTVDFGGDPVNLSNGNYSSSTTDMAIAGKVPIVFTRTYNALDFKDCGLGLHFKHNYNIYYEDRDDYVKVYFADGHIVFFEKNADGGYEFNTSDYQFVGYRNGGFTIEYKNGKTYLFGDNSYISKVIDKGNVINFVYETYVNEEYYNGERELYRLTEISSVSGTISLTYDVNNDLVGLRDSAGRTVDYAYDGKYLVSTTNVAGNTYTYTYDDDGRLVKVVDPYGNDQLQNVYDSNGKVYQQVNEDGTFYEYEYVDDKTVFTERDGTKTTYYKDEKGRIIRKDYVEGSERFVFDDDDNLIRYFDKNGNESTFDYDGNGNLSIAKDALGQITKYIHNQNGDLIEIEHPDGTKVYLEYDEHSNVLSITDELGQTQTFVYDADYNLVENVRQDGSVLSFTYDNRGNVKTECLNGTVLTSYDYDLVNRLVSVTDALGHSTTFDYAPNGNLVETIFADGSSTQNIYDKEARLVESVDGNGNSTRYAYNAMGSLSEVETADGSITKYAYDSMQNLVKTTFADGTEIENVYDAAGRLMKEIDELGNVKTYTYDNNGNILSTTDELGRVTSFDYDALNRLKKMTNPLGDESIVTYRYDGKILTRTDFAGKITSYDYDDLGRIIKVTTPDGQSERFSYDPLGNIISSTDKMGRETTYAYDDRSNLIRVKRPDGSILTNDYDLANHLVKSVDAMGNATRYAYDDRGRLVETTNALGDNVSLGYDKNGNVIRTTDENGNATTYRYDSMNRLIEVIDALGQSQKIEYDALGRVIKNINKDGSCRTLTYDAKGRLVAHTDELGFTASYAYDPVGNVLELTDKEGYTTTNQYDELNRLIAVTDPRGYVTHMTYDKAGEMTSVTDALGQTTTFEYDIMGNLVKEQSPVQCVKEFQYDAKGHLREFTDPHQQKTRYDYDELDRLIQVTFPDNTFKQQEYDKNGNITAVIDVLGNAKTYTYDALNRLVSVTDEEGITKRNSYTKTSKIASSTDGNGNVTSFDYDKLDRLVKKVNALGTLTTYLYDNRDNITEIITKTGVNQTVIDNLSCSDNYQANERQVSERFEYNARGERIKETSRLGYEKTYKYNKNGNLIEVLDEDEFKTVFSYDPNSNLVEQTITGGFLPELQHSKITYVYDALNRIIKRTDDIYTEKDFNPTRDYTYIYDEFGNLASETDFEGKTTSLYYDMVGNLTTLIYPEGTVVEYSYDSMNRVQTVTDKDGVNTYTYDELGRRTRLDFSNGTHEKYAYDKKGRTLSQVTGDKRNVTMTIHDYEYDNNDNITVDVFKDYKTAHSKDITVRTYAYDALNQLVTEQEQQDNYEKNGTKTTFYYDVAGNMVQKATGKLQTTSQKIFHIEPPVYITNYQYNDDNQLRSQRGVSEAICYHQSVAFDYDYDKRGNLTAIKDPWIVCSSEYIAQFYYDGMNKMRYSSDKQNKLTRYSYDGEGRRIFKESETILAMTVLTPRCDGCRGKLITEQILALVHKELECCMGKDFKTTQNFIYNPVSRYDDILLTYGKNMHSQRFIYGAKEKDKGLIKVDSYQLYGQLWDEHSTGRTYQGLADYHNDNYAKETFQRDAIISTYMVKDIRGSIEQQSGKLGYQGFTYGYTAFGVEQFPMNLNDIHGFAGYVRDRETDSYYVNARQYLPQMHRFVAKDKLRVDSLNRYLYVVNNPVNYVDPSGMISSILMKTYQNTGSPAGLILKENRVLATDVLQSTSQFLKKGYHFVSDVKTGFFNGATKSLIVTGSGFLKLSPIIGSTVALDYAFNKSSENNLSYQGIDKCEKGLCNLIDKSALGYVKDPDVYQKSQMVGYITATVGTGVLSAYGSLSNVSNLSGGSMALAGVNGGAGVLAVSTSSSGVLATVAQGALTASAMGNAIKFAKDGGLSSDCGESGDESFESGGFSRKWTEEEIRNLPNSKNSGIKKMKGNADDAYEFFQNQVDKSTIYKDGEALIGTDSEGIIFTYRKFSSLIKSNGEPTINIKGIKGIRKIKFIGE